MKPEVTVDGRVNPGHLASVVVLLGMLSLACNPPVVPESAEPGPAADWMTSDPADRPRITMINQIEYTDAEHPSAACGFLLDTGDEILAATAKHVLTYFKSEAGETVYAIGWRLPHTHGKCWAKTCVARGPVAKRSAISPP